jgi:membrane-associated phospholipid phosphatase
MPEVQSFVRRTVIIALLCTILLLALSGIAISLEASSVAMLVLPVSGIVLATLNCRTTNIIWVARLTPCVECLGLLAATCLIFAVATYPILSFSSGWRDAELAAIDELLHLDWLRLWNFVQLHPRLDDLLESAYRTIALQPMLIIIALVASGRLDQAYRFLAAMIISLCLTDTILFVAPAKSAAMHILGESFVGLPFAGSAHVPIIEQLRSGTYPPVALYNLIGLITFPSFHASACLLFVWAIWDLRWFRIPAVSLNALMLVSSLVHGGHYFVDLAGGLIVASLAVLMARRMPVESRGIATLSDGSRSDIQAEWAANGVAAVRSGNLTNLCNASRNAAPRLSGEPPLGGDGSLAGIGGMPAMGRKRTFGDAPRHKPA